jgi:hypothetical protein
MSQSPLSDVVAFDPFAFGQDGLASAEVDVGGPSGNSFSMPPSGQLPTGIC